MTENWDSLMESIHYSFNEVKLLELAMTHSSFANEREEPIEHNERLEFLGDAVLELCVSEELYSRFPKAREGQLTRLRSRLVSKPALAAVARELKLDVYLKLGRGEEIQGGRERSSILSDAFEALLAAIFLDSGFEAANRWIHEIFREKWPDTAEAVRVKDAKSRLQELTQRLFKSRPYYTLQGSSGPEHSKTFTIVVTLPDGSSVTASGQSLKKAEQQAASVAIDKLHERYPDSE